MSLLLALIRRLDPPAPPPENGPSGGANWLRGYKPAHDYSPKRRRTKRDELLIVRA
jgi:hypothetical protein